MEDSDSHIGEIVHSNNQPSVSCLAHFLHFLDEFPTHYTAFIKRFKYVIPVFWLLCFGATVYFALHFAGKTTLSFVAPEGTEAFSANKAFNNHFKSIEHDTNLFIIARNDMNTESQQTAEEMVREFRSFLHNKTSEHSYSASLARNEDDITSAFAESVCAEITEKISNKFTKESDILYIFNYFDVVQDFPALAQLMISKDRSMLLYIVMHSPSIQSDYVHFAYDIIDNMSTDSGKYEYFNTGIDSLMIDVIDGATKDLARMDITSLPVALAVLGLALFSATLIILPLINIVIAFIISFGLCYPFALVFDVASYNPPIMMSIIVAMSIDYCLFLLTRFKEDYLKKGDFDFAIENMIRYSGRIVISSGSILLLCFLSMLFFPLSFIYTVGICAGISLVFTILVSLTLTPSLLFIFPNFFKHGFPCIKCCKKDKNEDNNDNDSDLDEKNFKESENENESEHIVNDLEVPNFATVNNNKVQADKTIIDKKPGIWFRFSLFLHKPWFAVIIIAACLGIFVPGIYFFSDFKTSADYSMIEPRGSHSANGLKELEKQFTPGIVLPYKILVEGKNGAKIMNKEGFTLLNKFIDDLNTVEGTSSDKVIAVSSVGGIHISWTLSQTLRKTSKAYNTLYTVMSTQDESATFLFFPSLNDPLTNIAAYVDSIRKLTDQYTSETDCNFFVISMNCDLIDSVRQVKTYFPIILGITAVIMLALTAIIFRFAIVPFRAVVTVFITLIWSFGITTVAYVHEAFNFLLHGNGALYWFTPIITFLIVLGLSLDYDIFMFSRIAENRRKGWDTKSSISRGYGSSAGIVLCAGLIMVIAFIGLIPSSIETVEQCGFVLAISVSFQTVIMMTFFVPSLISLLGKSNWWPFKSDRERMDPNIVAKEQQPLLSNTEVDSDENSRFEQASDSEENVGDPPKDKQKAFTKH